jgi:Caspase domain
VTAGPGHPAPIQREGRKNTLTTVYEDTGPGPRMHAFVVGVGHYPYRDRTGGDDMMSEFINSLDPVSTAPASARAIADWLIEARRADPVTPLGSVELLLSWPGADYRSQPIEAADTGAFEAAFTRWYSRCDEDPDNVALFYFCGHGCDLGDQLLLLADFGHSRLNPFPRAVNLRRLHLGMRRCRARVQCFLVDACRTVPAELLPLGEVVGWSPLAQVLDVRPHGHTRDAPIVFATAIGQPAYGAPDQPTRFAGAVIDVLSGLGASQHGMGPWRVGTDRLALAIRDVLEWTGRVDEDQEVSLGGEPTGRGVLRTLSAPPEVPFEVGCDPVAALASADLTLIGDAAAEVLRRAAEPGIWCDKVPAGAYSLQAHFADAAYHDTAVLRAFLPPTAWHTVPVEKR